MNDATRRLERINPVPDPLPPPPMQPLLGRFEDVHAGPGPVNGSGPSRRTGRAPLGRWAGPIAMLGSLLVVAAVVAVIAIHAHHDSNTIAAGPSPAASGSRAALVETLGVLRRPQTRAERAIQVPEQLGGGRLPKGATGKIFRMRLLGPWGYPRVQRSLIRAVALPGGRFTIFPLTHRPSADARGRTEAFVLETALGGASTEFLSPTSVAALKRHGANLFNYAHGHNVGGIVVPDGVAKVQLDNFRVQDGSGLTATAIHATSIVVHDSVAVFDLPAPTVQSRHQWSGSQMASSAAAVRMTWYRGDGTIAKRVQTKIAFDWFRK